MISALTSPNWGGVSQYMAIEDFDSSAGVGWEPPEYHKFATSFLASYKPYVSPDALLNHMTTLFTQTTSDAERLPPSSPAARAGRTVRERVLYVLLLWLRRHSDDFESGTSGGPRRHATLTTFINDALSVTPSATPQTRHALRHATA